MPVTICLQRLVPANMLRDASIGILGQRRQGKTTLGEDLLYNIKPRRAYALCGSVGSMKSFRKFIYDTYVERATLERIEELVAIQAARSEDETLTDEEMEQWLIIDDKGFDKKFMRHATMCELASNGRQFRMGTLVMVQYLYQMPTELRGNLDYIFFTREQSVDNSEKARKQFGGLCGRGQTGVAVWTALCAVATMNRCVLVIDQTISDSVSVEDCYFWYQARFPMPRWRLGDAQYRAFHIARMKAAAADPNSNVKYATADIQRKRAAAAAAAGATAAAAVAGVVPVPATPAIVTKFVAPASAKVQRVAKKPVAAQPQPQQQKQQQQKSSTGAIAANSDAKKALSTKTAQKMTVMRKPTPPGVPTAASVPMTAQQQQRQQQQRRQQSIQPRQVRPATAVTATQVPPAKPVKKSGANVQVPAPTTPRPQQQQQPRQPAVTPRPQTVLAGKNLVPRAAVPQQSHQLRSPQPSATNRVPQQKPVASQQQQQQQQPRVTKPTATSAATPGAATLRRAVNTTGVAATSPVTKPNARPLTAAATPRPAAATRPLQLSQQHQREQRASASAAPRRH